MTFSARLKKMALPDHKYLLRTIWGVLIIFSIEIGSILTARIWFHTSICFLLNRWTNFVILRFWLILTLISSCLALCKALPVWKKKFFMQYSRRICCFHFSALGGPNFIDITTISFAHDDNEEFKGRAFWDILIIWRSWRLTPLDRAKFFF